MRNLISRRGIVAAITSSAVDISLVSAQDVSSSTRLVAYMSRSGNTRVIAGQVQRYHSADMFEIMPAQAYPDDYLQTVTQAALETDSGFEPPLKELVANTASYEVVFLGFPIWGMTAPPLIRSFLSKHDLSGKTISPFITHGGYGIGQALQVIAQYAPAARIDEPFVIQRDQELDTLVPVSRWLSK